MSSAAAAKLPLRDRRRPMHPRSIKAGSRSGTRLHRWVIRILAGIALAMLPLLPHASAAKQAVVLDIAGAIGPAIADYVVRNLRAARLGDVGVVILRMNTPGGLDSSMREINAAILASSVPVATYVAPNGARAASAGTYIAYASSIAAMAPGTNIGAATPIQLRGPSFLPGGSPQQPPGQKNDQGKESPAEPPDAESRKAVNDAAAYIRGLAELHGRNADWAVEAVRTAASLPASEALRLHVIDVIADDVPDLLRQIDGRRKNRTPDDRWFRNRDGAARLAHRDTRRHHQSKCCLHTDAVGHLWAAVRIPQSRGGCARPYRRPQPAGGAVCPQSAADQLRGRRARAPRHWADGGRGAYRQPGPDRRRRRRCRRDRRHHDVSQRGAGIDPVAAAARGYCGGIGRLLPGDSCDAAALAAPGRGGGRRDADRSRRRSLVLAGHRGARSGRERGLAGPRRRGAAARHTRQGDRP